MKQLRKYFLLRSSFWFAVFWFGLQAGMLGVAMVASCAAFKPVARTVNDIARDLCSLFVAENQQLVALSPKDFCKVHRNLEPFIDQVLAAKQAAGAAALKQPAP